MSTSLRKLEQVWEELGREDPLWGVLSHEDKRGGRWSPSEFLQTGERTVCRLHEVMMARAGAPERFGHVLDFGCGVGRLSAAWGRRADHVTGVDISPGMIETGRRLIGEAANVDLILNASTHLGSWPDHSMDFVFSYICLQHMPWPLAAGYVAEFARICRPGHWVAFQLPARQLTSGAGARLRQTLVEHLPFGLGRVYRKWRHGSHAVFDMFFTHPDIVENTAATAGLQLVHKEPDAAAGPLTEGYFYVFRKI
jgi:SAM-dependent methyltransferase